MSSRSDDGTAVVVEPAPKRLPEVFDALDDFVEATWNAFQQLERSEPSAALIIKFMFDRGFNALKGAKLLLEHDHWELAAAQVRLLFEMNLDAEEILSSDDPEAAAFQYAKYGALEEGRSQIADLRYAIASGRDTPEARNRLHDLETRIRAWFPEFLQTNKKSGERWQDTWSGRTIKQRAQASSNRMRKYQYETVFRFLSAHMHGNPTTVYGHDARLGDDFEARVSSDNRHIVEIAAMLMTLFAELWSQGKDHLPEMPPAVVDAIGRVLVYMGGPSSPKFDES